MVLTTVQRYWAACDQANLRLILHRFQVIRPPYVIVRKASSFTYKLSFYQSTVLSSHALDGHQMYFGGSVVGKASTTDRDLAHPSHNFHRVKKVRNLASFKTSLNFELPAFANAARYPNYETKMQCCDDHPGQV